METKITQEMIERAKQAASAEELLAVAKENGVELTTEDAQKYFEMWHTSAELSDEELDNVAGGCDGPLKVLGGCPDCGSYDLTPVKRAKVGLVISTTYKCNGCGKTFAT